LTLKDQAGQESATLRKFALTLLAHESAHPWLFSRREGVAHRFHLEGFDEGDAMSGRGFAEIVGGEMRGHSRFHTVRQPVEDDEGMDS
jgi:hypothetical protein